MTQRLLFPSLLIFVAVVCLISWSLLCCRIRAAESGFLANAVVHGVNASGTGTVGVVSGSMFPSIASVDLPDFGPCSMASVPSFTRKIQSPPGKVFAAICMSIRNEGPYLDEYIAHHFLLGFERFFVCNDDSEDNTLQILQPYVDVGMVVLIDARNQFQCCNLAADLHHNTTTWLHAGEVDGFLVPLDPSDTIRSLLEPLSNDTHTDTQTQT